jgi:hypothetical protein
MKNKHTRALLAAVIAAAAAVAGCSGGNKYAGSKGDRESLEKTDEAIHAAFARGDIDTIKADHHPEVIKALQYNKHLVGRDADKADLSNTHAAGFSSGIQRAQSRKHIVSRGHGRGTERFYD